jgi:hypothetical protein
MTQINSALLTAVDNWDERITAAKCSKPKGHSPLADTERDRDAQFGVSPARDGISKKRQKDDR